MPARGMPWHQFSLQRIPAAARGPRSHASADRARMCACMCPVHVSVSARHRQQTCLGVLVDANMQLRGDPHTKYAIELLSTLWHVNLLHAGHVRSVTGGGLAPSARSLLRASSIVLTAERDAAAARGCPCSCTCSLLGPRGEASASDTVRQCL